MGGVGCKVFVYVGDDVEFVFVVIVFGNFEIVVMVWG